MVRIMKCKPIAPLSLCSPGTLLPSRGHRIRPDSANCYMHIYEKCFALVFSLMILGQAYLVRRYVGTWLFPACIFGLFWFGFTFFPLAILFWVPVNPYAIAFIF